MPDFPVAFAAWSSRKLIALPIPTADLTDFPEKVPIVADAGMSEAMATGYDIRFTDIDGNELPYERESWAGGGGAAVTAIFWVKTDVATAGTYVWCYYGNAAAGDVSTTVGIPWQFIGAWLTRISPTILQKVGGNADWDSVAYSVEGYVAACAISMRAGQTDKHCAMGLSADPDDPTLSSIDYDWYFQPDGTCRVEVLTVNVGTHGNYTANTVFLITYDGLYVRFYKDGVLKYEAARATGNALYPDSAFYSADSIINPVAFGPDEVWTTFAHDNQLAADGGLTWGAEEHQPTPVGGMKPMNLKMKL